MTRSCSMALAFPHPLEHVVDFDNPVNIAES